MLETTDKAGEIKYAEINGFRARYRVRGEGHPIICVHGLMGSIEQEDIMAGERVRLSENYMVVHHDSRGRGESTFGSLEYRHYTWEGQAGDLLALMNHLELENAHFIGGSQGAAAVLALAIRQPDRVSASILINPPEIRAPKKDFVDGYMEWADLFEQKGMDEMTDLILSLPPNDSLKKSHPDMIAGYDRIMRMQDARVIAAATRGTVQYEPMLPRQLQGITCPVLVLSQRGDGLHPNEIAEYIVENIPDVDCYIAPSITHYSDNPNEIARRIMKFLTRVDGVEWD